MSCYPLLVGDTEEHTMQQQEPTGAAALDRGAWNMHYDAIWGRHTYPVDAVLSVSWERANGRPITGHVPVTDPDAVWALIAKHGQSERILVSIAPRSMDLLRARHSKETAAAEAKGERPKDKKWMRGGAAEAYSLPALFADIDVKDARHAAENLPTREEADAVLATFPLGPPTILIWTGGGYHAWWALSSLPTLEQEKAACAGLRAWLQSEFTTKRGWHVDDNVVGRGTATRVAGTLIGKQGDDRLNGITLISPTADMAVAA